MDFLKTNLFTVASDIRYFLLTGLKTLPLTIGGIMLLVGMLTANYGMLFFVSGMFVLAPLGAFLFNFLMSALFDKQGLVAAVLGSVGSSGEMSSATRAVLFSARDRNVCNVVGKWDGVDQNRISLDLSVSYWITMTFFFVGYMFTNATLLYLEPANYPVASNGSTDAAGNPMDPDAWGKADAGRTARRTQAVIAMIALSVLTLIVIFIRLLMKGISGSCDGPFSLFVGLLGGGFLGALWYIALSRVGNQRLSDVFGIANRLMIPMAMVDKPYACLPQA
jgi:hypothetical protein